MLAKRRRFGIAGKQQAIVGQQRQQFVNRGALCRRIKVNQQIAAKNHIKRLTRRGCLQRQQVAAIGLHLCAHRSAEQIAIAAFAEVPVAKRQIGRAKSVAVVQTPAGALQHLLADIDRLDGERLRADPGIEQRHRQRARLLAAGAGDAEQAQRPGAQRLAGDSFLHKRCRRQKGLGIAKKPRLWHHHLVDQRI